MLYFALLGPGSEKFYFCRKNKLDKSKNPNLRFLSKMEKRRDISFDNTMTIMQKEGDKDHPLTRDIKQRAEDLGNTIGNEKFDFDRLNKKGEGHYKRLNLLPIDLSKDVDTQEEDYLRLFKRINDKLYVGGFRDKYLNDKNDGNSRFGMTDYRIHYLHDVRFDGNESDEEFVAKLERIIEQLEPFIEPQLDDNGNGRMVEEKVIDGETKKIQTVKVPVHCSYSKNPKYRCHSNIPIGEYRIILQELINNGGNKDSQISSLVRTEKTHSHDYAYEVSEQETLAGKYYRGEFDPAKENGGRKMIKLDRNMQQDQVHRSEGHRARHLQLEKEKKERLEREEKEREEREEEKRENQSSHHFNPYIIGIVAGVTILILLNLKFIIIIIISLILLLMFFVYKSNVKWQPGIRRNPRDNSSENSTTHNQPLTQKISSSLNKYISIVKE